MVTLKIAQTADGYAAGGAHDPRLAITGPAANLPHPCVARHARRHHGRDRHGARRRSADDRARCPAATESLCAWCWTRGSICRCARASWSGARDFPTFVLCGADADPRGARLGWAWGSRSQAARWPAAGSILRAALRVLGARGITRVFSEGGPRVGAALIAQGLADEMVLFTSPKPLGRKGVEALVA